MARKKSKKKYVFLGLVVILLGAAFFTNPSEQKHKDKLRLRLMQDIREIREENGAPETLLGAIFDAFSDVLVTEIVHQIIEEKLRVSNYYVFSTSILKWKEEDRTVGVGLFGNIYIPSKLKEGIREEMPLYFQNRN